MINFHYDKDPFGIENRLLSLEINVIKDLSSKPFWAKVFGLNQNIKPINKHIISPFDVSIAQMQIICPHAKVATLVMVLPYLNSTMRKYDINTRLRQAHFLAQLAHESVRFTATKEYATGTAYEGRKNLGNIELGDGHKFRGRGLIQITGRANYKAYGVYINQDVTTGDNPKKLEKYPLAADCAGWFWTKVKKLNRLADADNIVMITKRINGGENGLEKRREYLTNAKKAFHIK